jgi:hypothetical protein
MAKLACPYCHHVQIFDREGACEECGNFVSRAFLAATAKSPPVYLATVGFTQHGKTTYLDSLTTMIENLGKISDRTYHEYLDDYTFDEVRHMRWEVQHRQIPESTQADRKPMPLQIGIYNFLDQPANTLVIYDLGGEVFDRKSDIQRFALPMQNVHTIWFFISVHDLENPPSITDWEDGGRPFLRSLSDLFSVYRSGMERLGVQLKGRNLLIVYTMADKIVSRLPEHVRNYIREDKFFDLARKKHSEARNLTFDPYAYMRDVLAISSELEDWTYDIEGGTAFINMVKDSGMNVVFTITSSIGRQSDPHTDRMIDFRRYRVLDPLIWAMLHNKAIGGERRILLVLDNHPSAKQVFENDLPYHLFDYLSGKGTVVTFFLGSNTSVSRPGVRPPDSPPDEPGPSLIGPLLEAQDDDALVLLVLDRPDGDSPQWVVPDLVDFDTQKWRKRIGILSFQDGLTPWEHSRTLNKFNELKQLLDELFPDTG